MFGASTEKAHTDVIMIIINNSVYLYSAIYPELI